MSKFDFCSRTNGRVQKASAEVFEIFSRYTNLIEQVSIDEAFLDVTDVWRDYGYAMEIAKLIKEDVRREVGLIISAGVSYNKFLAKIASDWAQARRLMRDPSECGT